MSDGFFVRHNVTAMFSHRQSTLNNGSLNKSLERLSSGYRINRSSDDIAGLAVSEKMRSQIRGAQQARRNAQDAVSLIQSAEAAMETATEIVQRMRELAVQAANGSYTDSDRTLIQNEIDQLKKALDGNAEGAEFNRLKLNAMETGHEQANLDLKTVAGYTYNDDGVGGLYDQDQDGANDMSTDTLRTLREKLEYWIDYAARQVWGRTGFANDGGGGTSPDSPISITFYENTIAMNNDLGYSASAAANATELYINLDAFVTGDGIESDLAGQTPEQIIAHEITHSLEFRTGSVSLEAWPLEGTADWSSIALDVTGAVSNGIANPAGAGAFGGGGGGIR